MAKNKDEKDIEINTGDINSPKSNIGPSGFLSKKFRELFKVKPEEKIAASDFKKEKKVLADYQDIVKSEKAKREVKSKNKVDSTKTNIKPPIESDKMDIPPVKGEHLSSGETPHK